MKIKSVEIIVSLPEPHFVEDGCLSGAPLNEPIADHGPFVMNTLKKLITAFEDFNSGKFGFFRKLKLEYLKTFYIFEETIKVILIY